MEKNFRETGIGIVGDVAWGTHFCQFYQTNQDLIDTLVPYFKAGLKNNEFCMWVTSEPLTVEEAKKALKKALPDLGKYLKKGQMEIIPYTQWYLEGGRFNTDRVLKGWVNKLKLALAKGYAGLRLTGNTFWLEKKDWKEFTDYEEKVNNVIGKYKMMAICTYSLNRCGAIEVADVVRNHQFALIKHAGKWEIIQSSDQKKAEETLRQTRDYLESLFNYANAPIICWDTKFKITRFNHAFEYLTDYKADEVVGKDLNILFPEDSRKESLNKIKSTLSGEYWEVVEIPILRKDGEIRIALWNSANIYAENGKTLLATIAQGQDITERKNKEEELRKLNRVLKALSDSNQAMMRATNESDYLNAVCKIVVTDCGYAMVWVGFAENNINKTVRPVAQAGFEKNYLKKVNITWQDSERGRGPTGTAIRTGKPTICRNMLTDSNFKPWRQEATKRGYVSSIVLPLTNNEKTFGAINIYSKEPDPFSEEEVKLLAELADDLVYGIMAIRLRLESKKAQEEIARLATFPELNPNPVVEVDYSGNICYLNPAAKKLFFSLGNSSIQSKFLSGLELIKDAFQRQKKPELLREVFAGGTWFQQQLYHVPEMQRIRIYSLNITARKKITEALRKANAELELKVAQRTAELIKVQSELNERKRLSDIGTLAATVAHELRNPLAAIGMATYNIRRKAENPLFEKHLLNIEKKINESNQIIDNLLFYSRIKPSQYERILIYDIIDECIKVVKNHYKKERVLINRKFGSLKGIYIEADPLQLKELFLNILNNAYDAISNQKGKIEIKSELDHELIRVSIADTGVGIAEENLNNVFEPFFTTKAKGTGLGLTVCKQIVGLHSGSIDIVSQEGKGTRVSVTLPLKRKYNITPT